jgi:hypothetical protein
MSIADAGDGPVTGAHAIAARDVPPYATAAGNRVRVVKYRFDGPGHSLRSAGWNSSFAVRVHGDAALETPSCDLA